MGGEAPADLAAEAHQDIGSIDALPRLYPGRQLFKDDIRASTAPPPEP